MEENFKKIKVIIEDYSKKIKIVKGDVRKPNEVLKAASTKWNFLQFTPGLVGGHCKYN